MIFMHQAIKEINMMMVLKRKTLAKVRAALVL